MTVQSLAKRGHALADPSAQLRVLSGGPLRRREAGERLDRDEVDGDAADGFAPPDFAAALADAGVERLTAPRLDTLQVNVGKLCNMTCEHCHVDAGPDRTAENMTADTADRVLELLDVSGAGTLDLTGGAPEMNPHFRRLAATARRLGRHVIDRCNLTILTLPRYADVPAFLADQGVEVVASLPCYTAGQRGRPARRPGLFPQRRGVEDAQRARLRRPIPALPLTLVYNPVGPSLPPPQAGLERDYKTRLAEDFGIRFTRLFTITNMPISRYLDRLLETGRYAEYMAKLAAAFNPAAVDGLMCRSTLSVNWDGALSDCDFNQMLALPLAGRRPGNIHDAPAAALLEAVLNRPVVTGSHCFGCTAGAGSGCTGAIV